VGQAGRRARGDGSDSASSPAGTRRWEGDPHLSSAAGAGEAERAGGGGVGRLGRTEVGPAAGLPRGLLGRGLLVSCWATAG
jgi:hypothetical protein